MAYDDHLKWLRIEANTLKKAEERGRQEGIIQTATSMLKKKLDLDLISEITGLNKTQLQELISD